MKRSFTIIALAAAALVSFSCSVKEEMAPASEPIRFRAVMEAPEVDPDADAATKAYADQNLKFYWNRGDLVSVFHEKTYNRQFIFRGRTGSTAGELERNGTDPDFFSEVDIESGYNYSIYPYDYDNACDYDGTLTVVFPEEKTYVPNASGIGADLIMAARDTGGDFFYMHVAGYLGFQLWGDGVSVSSITFSSNNGEPIAGYPLVVFTDDGVPTLTFLNSDPDNSTSMTVNYSTPVALGTSSSDATFFWMSVPPTILTKGFTITVRDADGGVFTRKTSSSFVIERRVFKTIAPLKVEITPSVGSVTLDKTEAELRPGETLALTATVLPDNAPDKSVSWSSSNPSVASVDGNGKVTALGAGTATITVTTNEGGKTAKCVVTVKSETSYRLTLSPASSEINFGETIVLTPTLYKSVDGTETSSSLSPGSVQWSVSDPSVVSVSGGTVSALKGGSAVITAKYTPEGAGEISASADILVKDVVSYSLAISPAEATVNVGESQTYEVTLTTVKNGVSSESPAAATLSSSDPSVASVSGNTVTAVKGGSATITAKFTPEGSAEELSATAALTAKDVISYSVALTPAEATLEIGDTQEYVLTLTTVKNGQSSEAPVTGFTLSSSDGTVASVSGATVSALKEGTVTLTAKYTPEGGDELSATATVTVNPEAVITYRIALTPAEATLKVGETQEYALALTAVKDGISTESSISGFSITFSDPSIASAEGNVVTALKEGEVTLTVKYTPEGGEELTATATLTVNKKPNEAGDPVIVDPDEEF
ncbi:MAG: Ig-like domain-containing protein [Bacteroidales bacterium]|nr:Ig-like domain-containing protein [Bacteroidales bacterium]